MQEIEGIGTKLSDNILNKQIKKDLKRHINYMKTHNIDIISIEEKEYPSILKQIYNPPICIYVIGKKEILNNPAVAIVGCRDATEYGKQVAKNFAYKMAQKGFNIVSGLARGIDTYAHIGAINANGNTIAVLGNGLDTIFPKENTNLAKEIIKTNGAIITEYPLGTRSRKKQFSCKK